jgi:threonine dehydratase
MNLIIEPSSAVALAPLLRLEGVKVLNLPARADGKPLKVGIILSGGNVDLP